MQRIKELFTGEDRGVSPVIGVILMVAITVILAAVIATFVIGLGDQTDEVAPTASFTYEYNSTSENVTITVDNVDQTDVDPSNIEITGEAFSGSTQWGTSSDSFSAGDSKEVSIDNYEEGNEIRIVFNTEDTSDTLDTDNVP